MNIMFRLTAKIEVSDADRFPPKGELEKELVRFFGDEGMIPRELEVSAYYPIPSEGEKDE